MITEDTEGEKYENCDIRISKSVTIRNCVFIGSSVRATRCNVRIINCNFINSRGRSTHAIQFESCNGGYIGHNYFEEKIGESSLSDVINIYKSNGTRDNPIIIEHNYLIGGGPHASGGGIMLGDNMGNYQVARNNICIDCGQYGIAIAGGSHNKILSNVVMSKKHPWSNVGIYVWGIPQRQSVVSDATVEHNRVSWINDDGKANPWWQGSNTSGVVQKNNVFNAAYAPPQPDNVGKL